MPSLCFQCTMVTALAGVRQRIPSHLLHCIGHSLSLSCFPMHLRYPACTSAAKCFLGTSRQRRCQKFSTTAFERRVELTLTVGPDNKHHDQIPRHRSKPSSAPSIASTAPNPRAYLSWTFFRRVLPWSTPDADLWCATDEQPPLHSPKSPNLRPR